MQNATTTTAARAQLNKIFKLSRKEFPKLEPRNWAHKSRIFRAEVPKEQADSGITGKVWKQLDTTGQKWQYAGCFRIEPDGSLGTAPKYWRELLDGSNGTKKPMRRPEKRREKRAEQKAEKKVRSRKQSEPERKPGVITKKELAIFQKLGADRQALPILRNVLFAKGSATMTNLTTSITIKCESKVKGLVPYPMLKPMQEFELIDALTIQHGSHTTKLSSPDEYSEFPRVKHITKGTRVLLDVATLQECLKHVCEEEHRPALCSVFVSKDGYVASNGHRLYWNAARPAELARRKTELLLDTELLELALKVCDTEEIDLRFEDALATLHTGKYTLTGRLIEGPYPDFQQVIPAPKELRPLSLDVADLKRRARAMFPFANPLTRMIRLDVEAEQVKLSCSNLDAGTRTADEMKLEKKQPLKGAVAFNIQLLNLMPDVDEIHFRMEKGLIAQYSPAVFQRDKETWLLMPLRMEEQDDNETKDETANNEAEGREEHAA